MTNVKPIDTSSKSVLKRLYEILAAIIILIVGATTHWKDVHDFFVPNDIFLNLHFVLLIIFLSNIIVFLVVVFFMNKYWENEYNSHQITKTEKDILIKEKDILIDALNTSEHLRLTDVITGIPNSASLTNDINNYFSHSSKKMQFIFIDLKDFRIINENFDFNKTNELLKTIAQTIYNRMRRNEQMYKCPTRDSEPKPDEKIYRVYPGGDEFVFIIFGDQPDALGFSNRLVGIFKELQEKTTEILGVYTKLSFQCAIVEMHKQDSLKDIFCRVHSCYKIAKQGESDFTICWHPYNIEQTFSEETDLKKLEGCERKLKEYERTRILFTVMTPIDKDYGL